jgi:hypothetical protein
MAAAVLGLHGALGAMTGTTTSISNPRWLLRLLLFLLSLYHFFLCRLCLLAPFKGPWDFVISE